MNRFLAFVVILAAFFSLDIQPSSAMVMFIPVKKGEVPTMIRTAELRTALSTVPPMGGTSTVGSWNHCTLYYRGTQQSLQQLLDSVDQIPSIRLNVVIDQSGKIGRVESTKFAPLIRTLVYQFSVSVSGHAFGGAGNQKGETVSITIHKAGGIDPSKLRLPKPKSTKSPIVELVPVLKTLPAESTQAIGK